MFRLGFFLSFLALSGAVRFHELIPDGETHFHGVPVEKYVSSWNRLMEIGHKLNGNTGSVDRFEDLDWDKETMSENPTENPFLFQGDIVLSEEQLDSLVESYEVELATKEGRHFSRLFSTNNPARLWDPAHFPIPWSVDATNPPAGGSAAIRRALAVWEEKTCLTFKENGASPDGHLEFYKGRGCSSPVGNAGLNRISIAHGCQGTTTIDHEVGHSLGLFHTQSRSDAGQYLDFLLQNVDANKTHNFLPPNAWFNATARGIPYDYGSAMQYNRFSFGLRRGLPTMLPVDRNYNFTMGERFEIAFTDAKEINMMYCDHVCPNKLPCRRGGYTDPKDCTKCRCPTGFAGAFCEGIAANAAGRGSHTLIATQKFQTLSATGNEDAIFKITAPPGKRLWLVLDSAEFQGEDWSFQNCQKHFVEVKYGAQFETVGARFCPQHLTGRKTMISATNEALVLYRSADIRFNFSLSYKYLTIGAGK